MFSVEKFQHGQAWTNWAERFVSTPHYYMPASIDEIVEIVRAHQDGRNIRVTGAAHSFSPVALPETSALSLHQMRGLLSLDPSKQEATFWAGTYLYEIGPILAKYGLAVQNMGDVDAQTLAGVVATGTHGTGVTLGSFSSMVTAWTFVDGQGEVVTHRRGNDDLSQALHLSLGLLGLLVQVTIQVVPLYSLHYESTRADFQTSLLHFQRDIRENRHVEWYYFPGSEVIQVKKMNMIAPTYMPEEQRIEARQQLELVENRLFQAVSSICKWQPKMSSFVAKASSKLITVENKTDICYEIYPTARNVKFNEAEFAIPLPVFEACMEEIHAVMSSGRFQVHFPIECRTTAGEVGFLSPTQGQESAFIAFHMYKGMDETMYFDWVFNLMEKYEGRAHWGKINRYHITEIADYYPEVTRFKALRQQYDPQNIWMTSYFKHIF